MKSDKNFNTSFTIFTHFSCIFVFDLLNNIFFKFSYRVCTWQRYKQHYCLHSICTICIRLIVPLKSFSLLSLRVITFELANNYCGGCVELAVDNTFGIHKVVEIKLLFFAIKESELNFITAKKIACIMHFITIVCLTYKTSYLKGFWISKEIAGNTREKN